MQRYERVREHRAEALEQRRNCSRDRAGSSCAQIFTQQKAATVRQSQHRTTGSDPGCAVTLIALPCLLGQPQLPFRQCQVPLYVPVHSAALGGPAVFVQPVTQQIQRLVRLTLIVQYMGIAVDDVERLWSPLQCPLDK